MEDLKKLQKILGYTFKDENLLETALTHSSFVNEHISENIESNERLEYLGDAVVDLVIGEYLYLTHSKDDEGILTKLRARSVNGHMMYKIAKKLNLGELIRFGKGEEKNGGRYRESNIEDAFEALIGAIFLDSSFEVVKSIILKLFADILNNVGNLLQNNDYKSTLQEYFQKKGKTLKYKVVNETGPDNDKTFFVELYERNNLIAKGSGKTKKKAEQDAAKNAVEKFEVENV